MTLLAASASFDPALFWERMSPDAQLVRALWTTLYVSVLAQLLGTALGLASALSALSKSSLLRTIAAAYVWFIRGTPVIVQIFFMFYGANLLLGVTLFPRELDLGLFALNGAVLAGIVALSINEGAYMSEIFRAGILSIDRGQMEAARSIGMVRRTAMRRIVLPQALRVVVPGLGNEFNNMLKTSSLLSFIGVYELFQDAQVWYSKTFRPVEAFLAVACWYLLLTTVWLLVQVQIERYLGASDRDEDERWYTRLFGVGGSTGAYA